jgi:hypothetical protein
LSECINLLEEFGRRFRVGFDPAYDPRHRPEEKLDPWMMTLSSRFATVYPFSENMLAVEVEGNPSKRRQLDELAGCKRFLTGEKFGCWLFPLRCFERVAIVVQPARKRVWTDSERKERAEGLKANLRKCDRHRVDSRISDAVSTMTGSRGPTGVRRP